jgi:hypothetical protein
MSVSNHVEMHRDHQRWSSETNMWRCDLAAWQHELADAVADVEQLKKALEAHGERLRKHAAAIRVDELAAEGHEHALAEYELGGSGENLPEYARKHSREADRQAKDREAHEHLKRLHHTIIAQWRLLLKSLTETP